MLKLSRQDNGAGFVGDLSDLVNTSRATRDRGQDLSHNFARDVRIVCRDGAVLEWNSILLRSISKVFRDFSAGFCPGCSPNHSFFAQLIWPDIDASAVEKVLMWCLGGDETILNESEATEVTEVIQMLGLNIQVQQKDFSDNSDIPDDDPDDDISDHEQDPLGCSSSADRIVKTEDISETTFELVQDESLSMQSNENSSENEFELQKIASVAKLKKKKTGLSSRQTGSCIMELPLNRLEHENTFKQCPCCKAPFKKLLSHLSSSHYASKILKQAGQKDLRNCSICGLVVTKGDKGKSIPGLMAKHLGVVHGLIEPVLPEDMKYSLVNEGKSSTASKQPDLLTCPICDKFEAPNFSSLKHHLSGSELNKEILVEAGIGNTVEPCLVCGAEKNASNINSWRKQMADHLGYRHDYLDKVMPDKAKKRWEEIKAKHGTKETRNYVNKNCQTVQLS